MLYPKNKAKQIDLNLFLNPTAEYRCTPFWAWNCDLKKDELFSEIDAMEQMGMGGFHMHTRVGMSTTYLSDEYMAFIKACTERAKEKNMLAWLYDEDKWPSGFAGGYVTKKLENRQKFLMLTTTPYGDAAEAEEQIDASALAKRANNGKLLCKYAVELDDEGYLKNYRQLKNGETAEGTVWYAYLETAKVLDAALVLHAEHGGGNNSTFTTHVVSSSGTDTYSAIAAALGSLKGPKHGGANIKVCAMFHDIKNNVKNWDDEAEVEAYLKKILHKEAFDKAGLIYGVGHAVYSISDPRATVFKRFVQSLSEEKGLDREFKLYTAVEKLAPQIIAKERKIYKGVSVNVDFYSGFVYDMLGLPQELYTPLFAIARIAGWSAHRIEELLNAGKIIRPAYKSVQPKRPYAPLEQR